MEMDRIHTFNQKIQCFFTFWKMRTSVFGSLFQNLFFVVLDVHLNSNSILWTSAKLYSPCLSRPASISSLLLLVAQPISQSLGFRILVSSLCVFLFFHIFYPLSHQACKILLSWLPSFFLSSILVQTLPQIQHFPNYSEEFCLGKY